MSQTHQDNKELVQDASWKVADELISNLRQWGIMYLVGLEHDTAMVETHYLSPVDLIRQLASIHEHARIRDASISLFLLHPELSEAIVQAIKVSEQPVAEQIITLVLATLYLQRKWSIRLALASGHLPTLPEAPFAQFWQQRHLPAPACYHGEWGLRALQAYEQQRTGLPFVFIGDWQNQVDHLLWQEEHSSNSSISPAQLAYLLQTGQDDDEQCDERSNMSMRPGVDKKAIETFLQQLGRSYRKPGRLYLVGGAALIHANVRPGFTQDIDIQVVGNNEGELIVAIQRLIQQMQINIEFASPGDFIPLPTQWEAHAQFVGRYGSIDVFYFDFYSIALSKMERGSTRDIEDVKLLVQQQRIALPELDRAYQEVLIQLGKGRYPKITPERFAARYTAVRAML